MKRAAALGLLAVVGWGGCDSADGGSGGTDTTPPVDETVEIYAPADVCDPSTTLVGDIQVRVDQLDEVAGITCVVGSLTVTRHTSGAFAGRFDLPALTQVWGDFRLSNLDQFEDLTMSSLEWVSGHVIVANVAGLQDLSGFPKLETVAGDLRIVQSNPGLFGISGFEALTLIGGDLSITNNGTLVGIDGFSALRHLGGDLTISVNSRLSEIGGLTALTAIGGTVQFSNNSLHSVAGLGQLRSIGGSLRFISEAGIGSLNDFSSLQRVGGSVELNRSGLTQLALPLGFSLGGSLIVENNPDLTAIDDLGGLTAVPGVLKISNQPALASLSGLSRLTRAGGIELDALPQLPDLSGLASLQGSLSRLTLSRIPKLGSLSGLEQITAVTGDVVVNNCASINSLSGLGNLQAIGGALQLSSLPAVTDLSGLGALTSGPRELSLNQTGLSSLDGLNAIGATLFRLTLTNNDALTDVRALSALREIETNVSLQRNPQLADLTGLDNIHTIGTNLDIRGSALVDMTAFSALTSATNITLYDNDALVSLVGLHNLADLTNVTVNLRGEALTDIAVFGGDGPFAQLRLTQMNALTSLDLGEGRTTIGSLSVDSCARLVDVAGLEGLTTATSQIRFYANPQLTDLSGLADLETVGNFLQIEDNPRLTTLGLDSLGASASTATVRIRNNQTLPQCLADVVIDQLIAAGWTGALQVESNRAGCTCTQDQGAWRATCN